REGQEGAEERQIRGRRPRPVEADLEEVVFALGHAGRARFDRVDVLADGEPQAHFLTHERRLTRVHADALARDVAYGAERLVVGMFARGLEGGKGLQPHSGTAAAVDSGHRPATGARGAPAQIPPARRTARPA